jgi:membrane-associated phospholipid phosphatase
MPSLHFGWNLLLGLGIIWNTKHIWARAFGVIMPASMFLAVVVTGNHFFLDVVAGTVVALGGLAIAYLIEKQGHRLWRLVLPDRVFRHLARSG